MIQTVCLLFFIFLYIIVVFALAFYPGDKASRILHKVLSPILDSSYSNRWFCVFCLTLCGVGVTVCSPKGTIELCFFFVFFALLSVVLADEYMHEEHSIGYKVHKEQKRGLRRARKNALRELIKKNRMRSNETLQMGHVRDQL